MDSLIGSAPFGNPDPNAHYNKTVVVKCGVCHRCLMSQLIVSACTNVGARMAMF